MIKQLLAWWVLTSFCALAGEWTNLWPGAAPGAAQPPAGSEVVVDGWRFREVEIPQYSLFQPEVPNGQCVVVLPGGGYTALAGDHEGRQFGEWFAAAGITAMVVKYRVSANDERGYQFPVPLLDARRALRVARSMAAAWRIDPEQIGVMGFSAGGHLASMCVTMFDETFAEETADAVDALSCRPAFGVLVYPVISMSRPHAHGGSKRRLMGEHPPAALVERLDTAMRVGPKSPPMFLIHSEDDHTVPLQNAVDFIEACKAHEVPVTSHFFATGGHGYGFSGRGDATGWTPRLAAWLEQQRNKKTN